jgi:16S rRNA (guanine527-N7)-methyltransferase
MTTKLGPLVAIAAKTLGATLDSATQANIATWLARLEEWNARMDLTAARSPEELVDLMLADALVLAGCVPRGSHIVDVGTGAGAPGLALALVRPDLHVTLIEPLGKRASFLRTVIGEVRRVDIAIERVRGQAAAREHRVWDVALSRATLPAATWLDLATNLVNVGGTIWVFVVHEDAPAHARAVIETELAYEWPLTRVHRRGIGYRRV